ncbi:MAG: nicotinamide mononucleotide transporter [Armatimonadetes bacterium]|nr:nicotinamide mononucleotide transporter [Armatimonadota bacterium]
MSRAVLRNTLLMSLGSFVLAILCQAFQAYVSKTPITWIPSNRDSWIEVVGFVTGVVGVYLVIKESLWNWPVGIVNVLVYAWFFFIVARHYANAALQLVFFGYLVEGWWRWKFGGENHTELKVSRLKPFQVAVVTATIVLVTFGLVPLLERLGGQVPFWDALTFSISLAAQFLLNRKVLENWILWILADAIYVPLYSYRQYYTTAALYLIFFVLAIAGLAEWRRSLARELSTPTA